MAADATRLALFLFAHQDDEFGVFQQILDEQAAGRRVVCAYLTNGAVGTVTSMQRNAESLRVLGDLGVARADVVFAGEALGIADGALPRNLQAASSWLESWLAGLPRPESIHVLAWEGGHHDHDALHALAVIALAKQGLLGVTRQFALYNVWRCRAPFFRVLRPIPENGPVTATPIPWRNRLRFLRYCLSYPSQTKTWLGLFPFMALRYLLSGEQQTQSVTLEGLDSRPYQGTLFYEARGIYTWDALTQELKALKQ